MVRKWRKYWDTQLEMISRWFQRFGLVIITALLVGVAALLIYFLVAGFSSSTVGVSLAIAALAVFFAAIGSIANLLGAVEAQRLREAQEMPYVHGYFDGSSKGMVYFVICNSGNSPAQDVRIKFDPAPIDFADRSLNEVSLFAQPITFMPPGQTLRQAVHIGHKLLAEGKPTRFSVLFKYKSIRKQDFQETTIHDLAYLKQATLPGKTVEDSLEALSKDLRAAVRVLRDMTRNHPVLIDTLERRRARLLGNLDEREGSPSQAEVVGLSDLERDTAVGMREEE